ncbi:MAG: hypothetical protein GX455_13105 [Phycisphaerae bacterium]|nr:hypothetical protein [Phycisphaerae bacterium]
MNQSQSHCVETRGSVGLEARSFRLPGGGSGYCLGPQDLFDAAMIRSWMDRPDRLVEGEGQVLKTDRGAMVVRRSIVWAGRKVDCIIKYQRYDRKLTDRLRGFFPLRAISGFRTAIRLVKAEFPTPRPLLAVEKQGGFRYPQSLLITEYIPDSIHLYGYLQDHLFPSNSSFATIKRLLARQVATVFLRLDQLGLRHRDAKPSNWLVQSTPEGPRLWLVDLDGIRPKGLKSDGMTEGLSQLASKLLWCPNLFGTDYLRAYRSTFDSDRMRDREWKDRYRRLARLAVARRVMTLAETMLGQTIHLREGQVHA